MRKINKAVGARQERRREGVRWSGENLICVELVAWLLLSLLSNLELIIPVQIGWVGPHSDPHWSLVRCQLALDNTDFQ